VELVCSDGHAVIDGPRTRTAAAGVAPVQIRTARGAIDYTITMAIRLSRLKLLFSYALRRVAQSACESPGEATTHRGQRKGLRGPPLGYVSMPSTFDTKASPTYLAGYT